MHLYKLLTALFQALSQLDCYFFFYNIEDFLLKSIDENFLRKRFLKIRITCYKHKFNNGKTFGRFTASPHLAAETLRLQDSSKYEQNYSSRKIKAVE